MIRRYHVIRIRLVQIDFMHNIRRISRGDVRPKPASGAFHISVSREIVEYVYHPMCVSFPSAKYAFRLVESLPWSWDWQTMFSDVGLVARRAQFHPAFSPAY